MEPSYTIVTPYAPVSVGACLHKVTRVGETDALVRPAPFAAPLFVCFFFGSFYFMFFFLEFIKCVRGMRWMCCERIVSYYLECTVVVK